MNGEIIEEKDYWCNIPEWLSEKSKWAMVDRTFSSKKSNKELPSGEVQVGHS